MTSKDIAEKIKNGTYVGAGYPGQEYVSAILAEQVSQSYLDLLKEHDEPDKDHEIMPLEDQYWLPTLVDREYFNFLRKEYPDKASLSDDELRDYFCNYQKYATTWDHIGDAYEEYEPLADAYLDLLKKWDGLDDPSEEMVKAGCRATLMSRGVSMVVFNAMIKEAKK